MFRNIFALIQSVVGRYLWDVHGGANLEDYSYEDVDPVLHFHVKRADANQTDIFYGD